MARKPRPKVNMFPDEDKEWGGYKDAVQCIHCRRWMVVDFQKFYPATDSHGAHHIIIFKQLEWDGYSWYISRHSHNPRMCQTARENRQWAKKEGYKSYGQFKRIMKRREQEAAQ